MLTRSTLDTRRQVREQLAEGARARRPRPERHRGLVAVADDRRREPRGGARRAAARACLLCRVFPALQPDDGRARLRDEAAAIAEAWARGDRAAAERAVSDALIDATSIAGTPEQCRERIDAYRRSGIDLPIISPYARGPEAKARFEAVIRACAPTSRQHRVIRLRGQARRGVSAVTAGREQSRDRCRFIGLQRSRSVAISFHRQMAILREAVRGRICTRRPERDRSERRQGAQAVLASIEVDGIVDAGCLEQMEGHR